MNTAAYCSILQLQHGDDYGLASSLVSTWSRCLDAQPSKLTLLRVSLLFSPFSVSACVWPLFPPIPTCSNMFQLRHLQPHRCDPSATPAGWTTTAGAQDVQPEWQISENIINLYWIIIEPWHHYFFIVILCGIFWHTDIQSERVRWVLLKVRKSLVHEGNANPQRRECNWKWTALTQLWLWNLRQDTLRVLTFALVTIQSCFGSMTCRHTAVCTTKWDEIATDLQALVFITYTLSFLETLRVEWRRENSLVSTSISALVLLLLRKPWNL